MAETKVGFNQRNNPAPLWFRRVRDACVNFLLPGAATVIAGWGLSEQLVNRWLLVLTYLPLVLNGIATMLGEDVKKKVQVWIVLACVTALMAGCRTQAEIAAAKLRKQAVADSIAREHRMQLYQQVRLALPCVPDTLIRGLTVYLPGDSVPCPVNGKCPPPGIRVDTLKVLDEVALAALRDSLAQANYVDGLKDTRLDELAAGNAALAVAFAAERDKTAFWRRIVLWAGGIIVSVLIGWLALGGKLSFIKKAISWLISFVR